MQELFKNLIGLLLNKGGNNTETDRSGENAQQSGGGSKAQRLVKDVVEDVVADEFWKQQFESGFVKLEGEQLNAKSLPDNLKLTELNLSDCSGLTTLPKGLECTDLVARNSSLESISADMEVQYRLDLSGSRALEGLPDGLTVDYLLLRNCTALNRLPEGMDVFWLDVSGCTRILEWPLQARVKGRFIARNCDQFTQLPGWLQRISELDVRGWRNLTALPQDLVVTSSLDIGGTAITSLPEGCRDARLCWRGVTIDERIAFSAHLITVDEILAEVNTERRRVMIERLGYERFFQEAKAKIIDKDNDSRGGERRLLILPLKNDEPIVCVAVTCPSTGRNYILRVPPATKTCKQAVAWICGFDDPRDFLPLQET